MGHFSFKCKHCGRDILDTQSTWKGLNEWMSSTVVLTEDGSRLMGEYDGYGRVGDADSDSAITGGAVWAHKACWREAGKPEFEDYDGPSSGSQHSGYDDGDLIPEPGKPVSQVAWVEALEARKAAIRATHVRNVMEASRNGRRFYVWHYTGEYQSDPENPKPAGWVVSDNMMSPGADSLPSTYGLESEEIAKAEAQRRTAVFEASDEFAAIKAEHEASLKVQVAEYEAELKEKGRERYEAYKYSDEKGWVVCDHCDIRNHDEAADDTYYMLQGAAEEDAKALADKLNAEWRAA
jgi:hypothetical protein